MKYESLILQMLIQKSKNSSVVIKVHVFGF